MQPDQTKNQELKFERRGFEEPQQAETEIAVSAEEADKLMGDGVPQGQPQDMTFDDGQPEEPPFEPEQPEGQPEEKPTPKIRIGDKEFASQEEAFNYANELAQKDLVNDAFRQGMEVAAQSQAGLPSQQAPAPAEPEDNFDEEFYANPKEFLKKREAQIAERIQTQIAQQAERAKKNEETWGRFYQTYPDLDKNRDLVTFTLQQNWNQLAHIDTDRALKILADKVRDTKKAWLADATPGQELKQVRATASAGVAQKVTQRAPEEKPSTFIENFRSMKMKRKARK